MSANTWFWVPSPVGTGNFSDVNSWETIVGGTIEFGLPGPVDVADDVTGKVTGSGSVGFLGVSSTTTFSGNVTADEITGDGNLTVQGMLTASDQFLIPDGMTLAPRRFFRHHRFGDGGRQWYQHRRR